MNQPLEAHPPENREAELEREVAKLKKIQRTLMDCVERNMNVQGSAFSLFQTAAVLEAQVRTRTVALENTLADLEKSYREVASARQAAETAQLRLLAAIESSSEGFALFDAADRLILFNRTYLDFWPGIADKFRIGMDFTEAATLAVQYKCVIDAYRDPDLWVRKRLEQHAQCLGPSIHALSDGRWMQVDERRTRDGGIVAVYTDITGWKRRETQLREAELARQTSLLQATLDNLFQGVAVYDRDLALVAWNYEFLRLLDLPTSCAQTGASYGELREFLERAGIAHQDLLDPGTNPTPLRFEQSWHNKRILDIERNRMPDGGFILTFLDITGRKRIEEALQDGERRIRLITDAMPALIAYADKEARYQFVNEAYRQWLGLPTEAIVGRKMDEVVPAELHERRREFVKRALGGEFVDFEVELTSAANDQPRFAQVTFTPHFGEDGQILGFFTLMRDVTERRRIDASIREANEMLERRVEERTEALTQLNAQLQLEITERRDVEAALHIAKSQAEQANLSKTRFLAAASHDLLQPLNSARLFAAALSDIERNKQKSALIDNLGASLSAVEDLLDALLDISKLDAGAVSPEITDFPIGTLLGPLTTEHSVLARERGLELHFVPSSAVVRTDVRLLRQIVQNFLTNAIRYTRRGRVLLGCRRRATGLSIEVWDTGPGIPNEQLTLIFEEFRQLDPSPDRRTGGIGLGLAIVDRTARMLDLPIRTRSIVGRGSGFTVEVPFGTTPESIVRRPEFELAIGQLSDALILVIDDQQSILTGMEALLAGWGCEVATALSGAEARDLLRHLPRHPDVVIADFHLAAGRTGVEEIDQLRDVTRKMLDGIIITADHGTEVQALVKQHGCWLLRKPLNPAQLRALLSSVLARARMPLPPMQPVLPASWV